MAAHKLLKHNIGVSKNQRRVYGYLTQDPVAVVIGRNPHLLSLIKETISTLDLVSPTELIKRNMGRPIGYTEVVATKSDDIVFFAQQTKDGSYVRYVKNRKVESTSMLSLELTQDNDGNYELHAVILGKQPLPFPESGTSGTATHRTYWENHAIVYNGQAIRGNTILKDWPASASTSSDS
jgi:hypothetical protein